MSWSFCGNLYASYTRKFPQSGLPLSIISPLPRRHRTADTHSLRDVAARTVDAAIDLALGRFRTAVVRR